MAARPAIPATRRAVPPPPRKAVPAAEVEQDDTAAEDAPDDAIAVVRLRYPVKQIGRVIDEIRFLRRPRLEDLTGFGPGIGAGLSTHCVELTRHVVPRICDGILPATVGKLDLVDATQLVGVVLGFLADSPPTGGSSSEH